MSHKKWKPEVIVGGGADKPKDLDPTSAAFGRALDKFVANYCKAHPQLDHDVAIVVMIQHVAGVAVVKDWPKQDFVDGSRYFYEIEHHARKGEPA